MTEKVYKTTKADYNKFKAEVKYWVDFFGLYEFEVYCDHMYENGDRATCSTNKDARIAVITLGTEWCDGFDESEIRRVAFHEVAELLISQLWALCLDRFADKGAMETERHAIIKRLENTVWKKDWEKRKRSKKKGK